MIQDKVEQVNYLILYSEYIIGLWTLIIGYLYYRLKKKKDELKSVQEKLSEQKYKLYNELYSVFFDLIKAKNKSKNKKAKMNISLANKLVDIKKDMFIYAPDEILIKFLQWNKQINEADNILENMMDFFDILVSIRKDMGNDKTIISNEDILESILISENETSKLTK